MIYYDDNNDFRYEHNVFENQSRALIDYIYFYIYIFSLDQLVNIYD